MQKDFKKWNLVKEKVNNKNISNLYFKEQEVWYCYFGCNVGFEQDGKGCNFLRPVLIFKKFNKNLFFGIPLTSKNKENNKFYFKINIDGTFQSLILSQMKVVDSKRLIDRKFFIPKEIFIEIKKVFMNIIS